MKSPGAISTITVISTILAVVLSMTALACLAANPEESITRDFTAAEPGEDRPGGAATHFKVRGRNAFSFSSANMRMNRGLDFKVGNGFFRRIWVSAPSSTKAADGLGPLFNAKSCQQCHIKDGRGHPPKANWPDDDAVSMFLRLSIPPETEAQRQALAEHRINVVPEPTYGRQLQDLATAGQAIEGRMHVSYVEQGETLADGSRVALRKPSYKIVDLGYGPMHPATMLSPRIAPPMIGLGLLEQIPAAAIMANADPDDRDGDGISGRAQLAWDPAAQAVALGRFGWKAGAATIDAQNQSAFHGDIGISTPLNRSAAGECTARQAACRNAPHGDDARYDNLEAHRTVTDLVLFYTRHLALPARIDAGKPQVLAGKKLFYESGCIVCHRPKFRTAPDGPEPELRDQLIWPYSDMLLHDMGDGLADGRPEGVAGGREWRTAPLWGIGLTATVGGEQFFLHDGRARTLLEAIMWHGGEAEAARSRVRSMSALDREALLRFLESL